MNRPDAEHGFLRGRDRLPWELGLVDPAALPARGPEALENYRHSAAFVRTSGPEATLESQADFRSIHGFPLVTGFDAFTFALWVKWPSTGTQNVANAGIIGAGDATSTGHWGLSWGPTSISGLNFWVRAQATVANREIFTNVPADTWVHVMGTYNRLGGSPTLSGFVNGDNAGWTATSTFATAFSLEGEIPLVLGCSIFHSSSTTQYSNTRMMNLLYWNRKLSASELAAVYNGGNPHPAMTASLASGLRLWWRLGGSYQERQRMDLDPRQAGVVYDASGNAFHGVARSRAAPQVYPTYVEDAP